MLSWARISVSLKPSWASDSLGPPMVILGSPSPPATRSPEVSWFLWLVAISWKMTLQLLCLCLLSSPVFYMEIQKHVENCVNSEYSHLLKWWLLFFFFCLFSWLLFLIFCSMYILSFYYLMRIVLICFPPSKSAGFVQAASAFGEAGTLSHSLLPSFQAWDFSQLPFPHCRCLSLGGLLDVGCSAGNVFFPSLITRGFNLMGLFFKTNSAAFLLQVSQEAQGWKGLSQESLRDSQNEVCIRCEKCKQPHFFPV